MAKKDLTETEIRTRYITPAIRDKAGWAEHLIREEKAITDGRIHVMGNRAKRGKRKFADYILFHESDTPLAIVEAKSNNQAVGAGLQQAMEYAEMMDVPFVYSSNGDGFVEHDRTKTEGQLIREIDLDAFPSPDALWARYRQWKQLTPVEEEIITQSNYLGAKAPRYYQQVAINRTVEAVAKGQKRMLLVMATGTGKTYTASQIMYRLWKAKKAKRILFLADRNVLVDQARTNDFKVFGDVMTKVSRREIDKSYEVYLALYQQLTGPESEMDVFKEFSPDFFDLIFVDECHRGSAADDSAWREVLEYFNSAVQIGLTATPKETVDVSNIDYFGEPIYSYSLKNGIADGFLAPYKVIRIDLDKDIDGWRPRAGQKDIHGYVIPDEVYYGTDFDATLTIEERTQLVAALITEYLKATNRMDKTIVFCRRIEHAEEMRRALINENADLYAENSKYIMRITGDSLEGKQQLDSFIDPEEPYPVIVTTSKLLNTGVDTQTVKLIVLDNIINSMTEFKQIIGRGSRVREAQGKYFYAIMDFRNATRLFQDPDFDGDPVQIFEPGSDEPVTPPQPPQDEIPDDDGGDDEPNLYKVRGVPVHMIRERVQYLGKDGQLITESYRDYSRRNLLQHYPTLEKFLEDWFSESRKDAIIRALLDEGVFLDQLQEETGLDIDPFDLICHLAYDRKLHTRSERARNVKAKPAYFEKYSETARKVIEALLDRFAEEGYETFDKVLDSAALTRSLNAPPLNEFGRPLEVMRLFGGKKQFQEAMRTLQIEIYHDEETH